LFFSVFTLLKATKTDGAGEQRSSFSRSLRFPAQQKWFYWQIRDIPRRFFSLVPNSRLPLKREPFAWPYNPLPVAVGFAPATFRVDGNSEATPNL
jgi:hypothetical protein